MLATVLFQRDIAAMAGNEATTGLLARAAVVLMGEVAKPLVTMFA